MVHEGNGQCGLHTKFIDIDDRYKCDKDCEGQKNFNDHCMDSCPADSNPWSTEPSICICGIGKWIGRDEKSCVPNCSLAHRGRLWNETCYESCPDNSIEDPDNFPECKCLDGYKITPLGCTKSCSGQLNFANKCYPTCPYGSAQRPGTENVCLCTEGEYYNSDGDGCSTACIPENNFYDSCVYDCPQYSSPIDRYFCKCDPGYEHSSPNCIPCTQKEFNGHCVSSCPSHSTAGTKKCICDPGYGIERSGEGCEVCPKTFYGMCVSTCPKLSSDGPSTCSCNLPLVVNPTKTGCIPCPLKFDGTCVDGCPSHSEMDNSGACICHPAYQIDNTRCSPCALLFQAICISQCPQHSQNKEGSCICDATYEPKPGDITCTLCDLLFNGECVESCPQDSTGEGGVCICHDTYEVNPLGTGCSLCPLVFNGKCIDTCPNHSTDITGICTCGAMYIPHTDPPACSLCSTFFDNKCISSCPAHSTQDSTSGRCLCDQGYGVHSLGLTCELCSQVIFNTKCASTCPANTDYDDSTKICSCKIGHTYNQQGTECALCSFTFNSLCVLGCPDHSTQDHNQNCICNQNYQVNPLGTGCSICPTTFEGSCTESCPQHSQKKGTSECVCDSTYKSSGSGTCIPCIPTFNGGCVDSCPPDSTQKDNVCTCDPTFEVDNAQTGCSLCSLLFNNICAAQCPLNSLDTAGVCHCKPTYQLDIQGTACTLCDKIFNNQCVDSCPENSVDTTTPGECKCSPDTYQVDLAGTGCAICDLVFDGKCVASCPSESESEAGSCRCKSRYEANEGSCTLCELLFEKECISGCPEHSAENNGICSCSSTYEPNAENTGCASCALLFDGECIQSCPIYSTQNANQCECNHNYIASGLICVLCTTYFNNICVQSCPLNSTNTSSNCLCDDYYQMNSLQDGCEPCPALSFSGLCLDSCPAKSHDILNDGKCLCSLGYEANSTGDGCSRCEIEFEEKCVSECPEHTWEREEEGVRICKCGSIYDVNGDDTGCIRCRLSFNNKCYNEANCPSHSRNISQDCQCEGGYEINVEGDGCAECPSKTFNRGCVDNCPAHTDYDSNTLVCTCSPSYKIDPAGAGCTHCLTTFGGSCIDVCPHNSLKDQGDDTICKCKDSYQIGVDQLSCELMLLNNPTAIITGGNQAYRVNLNLTLSAQTSINYLNLDLSSKGLKFLWECFMDKEHATKCYVQTSTAINYTIPPHTLDKGIYYIQLTVTYGNYNGISRTTISLIESDGGPLIKLIRMGNNIGIVDVEQDTGFKVEFIGEKPKEGITYTWSIDPDINSKITTQEYLTIPKGVLTKSKEYMIRCKVSVVGALYKTEIQEIIETLKELTKGRLSSAEDQMSGLGLDTLFTFTATDFKGINEGEIINYKFVANIGDNLLQLSSGFTPSNSLTTTLPVGRKDQNYAITVSVIVRSYSYSLAPQQLNLTVKPKEGGYTLDYITSFLAANNNTKEEEIRALNIASSTISESSENKSILRSINNNINNLLIKGNLSSVDLLGLLTAGSESSEGSDLGDSEANKICESIVAKMMGKLTLGDLKVESAGELLLTMISNSLTGITVEHTLGGNKVELEERAKLNIENIKRMHKILLKNVLVGRNLSLIKTNNFELTGVVQNTDSLGGFSLGTEKGPSVILSISIGVSYPNIMVEVGYMSLMIDAYLSLDKTPLCNVLQLDIYNHETSADIIVIDMNNPVKITFTLREEGKVGECVFYDFDDHQYSNKGITKGDQTHLSISCLTTHLSQFTLIPFTPPISTNQDSSDNDDDGSNRTRNYIIIACFIVVVIIIIIIFLCWCCKKRVHYIYIYIYSHLKRAKKMRT